MFCKSDDVGITIQGLEVCRYHLSVISGIEYNGTVKSELRKPEPLKGNKKIVTLDDAGRLIIPSVLSRQLGWVKGGKLTASLNTVDKHILLTANEDGDICIEDLSLIKIPKYVRTELGWSNSDKIAVTLDVPSQHIKLNLEDKYIPSCVFCGSAEVVMAIQSSDICSYHLATIKYAING